MAKEKSLRLDQRLMLDGLYGSRSRARDAIARGCVTIGGTLVTKAGTMVAQTTRIEVVDEARGYVSRAALKLLAGLEASGFNPEQKICLDIGASTGGFTQVLLERGAQKVYAIDVGHDQLADDLMGDPRVVSLEGRNIRDLTLKDLDGQAPEFLVCDVSFISLQLALPNALALAKKGATGIFLIKPQFEVGRENIGKGGLVKDPEIGEQAAKSVADWFGARPDWRLVHFMGSPVTGSDGNQEYLMIGSKDD